MSILYQFKISMSYDENQISHHKNDTEKSEESLGNGDNLSRLNRFIFQTESLLPDQRYENWVEKFHCRGVLKSKRNIQKCIGKKQ